VTLPRAETLADAIRFKQASPVTLPIIRMIRALPSKEAKTVREMISIVDHGQEKRAEIARRVRELDLIAACTQTARDHVWAARKALEGVPDGPETKALYDIAEFVVDRVA